MLAFLLCWAVAACEIQWGCLWIQQNDIIQFTHMCTENTLVHISYGWRSSWKKKINQLQSIYRILLQTIKVFSNDLFGLGGK